MGYLSSAITAGSHALARKRNPKNFETALQEFEKLVERMEAGDMDLEEALRSYERGMELGRICQSALDEAEQRIEVLTQARASTLVPVQQTDDEQ